MSGGTWRIRPGRGRWPRGGGETSAAGRWIGRLLATLFFGAFAGLGLLFVAFVAREAWRAAEPYAWDERRCEILESRVVRAGGDDPYQPRVRYDTVGGGERVSGSQIQRRELAYDGYGDAARRLDAYPQGATVACYVSPEREAVLERGPLWIGLWVLLPCVFVAIGAIGLVATWRPERRDRFGDPLPDALADRAARVGPSRGLFVAGLALAGIGAAGLWFVGVLPLARAWDARSWIAETCVVEHSSVVAEKSDDGTSYRADILYRWDRGRGVERSSRYGFFVSVSSGRSGVAAIVRAHPVDAGVRCWVHPERSNEAVLERGLTAGALVAGVPLGFLVGGVAMCGAARRRTARRARMRQQAATGESPFRPDDPILEVLPAFESVAGPVTLVAQSSPWRRLLGLTALTLFWNGIVGVFCYQVAKGFERGDPEWFLVLFLVPFVLVGIGFVFGVLHSLLALGNPRPVLQLCPRSPRLGERVELQWRLRGSARRLAGLRIALAGVEQATYQVGTDTRTASEDFFEQAIADFPAPVPATGGHASFELPAASMHSFEARRNQIRWELRVRGEIPRWPDVSETFPLVVLPGRADEPKSEDR